MIVIYGATHRLGATALAHSRPWLRWAIMVLALLLLAGCKDRVDLQSGLSDVEANDVIAALHGDGIPAQKRTTKEGVTVSIPEPDLARANAVLTARGLPKRRQARLGEVFKKEGLISSPLEERARYVYALSQELEFTLAQIDGVIVARVHVVLPEKVVPGEPVIPSSAAVFVKHTAALEPDVVAPRIRKLLARSIPGLGAGGNDKISTVFVQGQEEPPRPVVEKAASSFGMAEALGLLIVIGALSGAGYWQRRRLQEVLERARTAVRSGKAPLAAEAAKR